MSCSIFYRWRKSLSFLLFLPPVELSNFYILARHYYSISSSNFKSEPSFPTSAKICSGGRRFRRRFNSIPFVVGILITTKYLLILTAWILEIMHSSIPPMIVRCFDSACAALKIINILNLIRAIYGRAFYNRGVIVDVIIQVLVILISCGKCAFLMLNLP